ncbi:fluoride efflux transporter FluC [Aeromicrobium sp. UC242_57]|uniref:fluoride efflux transporter FluC n=1 Tax=Aeromicrobium sp. UC242_57 TaxID=3374624 RepID=UPI0037B554C3
MTTLLMALAGGLGAGTRFGLDSWLRPHLAWPTHVVNITGSFALGLLIGLSSDSFLLTVVGVGFLGGYTTFSTASVEVSQLVLDRRYTTAAVNAGSMLLLSVAAAACGYWIS